MSMTLIGLGVALMDAKFQKENDFFRAGAYLISTLSAGFVQDALQMRSAIVCVTTECQLLGI